ncbi:hypothetical protein NQ315_008482 [Exocentrus adspersus]|uniref:Innexin n=1 Tax=Exocentrus adspersus TaxID=1586481 RepID=A0AAV8W5G1_9CUCU|nr:hypothetical protein NQ315_008482 [Exocentrus adspersus]
MHSLYTISNGPLHYAISQMGRNTSERIHKERIFFRTHSHQPLRTKKRRFPDPRPYRRRRVHADEGFRGMDLLRGVYTLTQSSSATIDSPVFRLHTNATVILLVTFSIAVTTRQYVGNPIDCVHTRDIPEDVLNTYCWIHSTYTVLDANKKPITHGHLPGIQATGKNSIKQTKYYQWVAFFLFFQVKPFFFNKAT